MTRLRYLPFLVLALNALGGVGYMVTKGATSGVKSFVAFNVLLAVVAAVMFVRQGIQLRARVRAAELSMQEIAKTALDTPVAVERKFESSLVGGAGLVAPGGKLDLGEGFTIEGAARGIPTRIATLVSTAGRQGFELMHTYSYVTIDRGEAVGRLRLVGRDLYAQMTSVPDRKIGDASFDAGWQVAGDSDLTREVLDDDLRAQLVSLQKRARRSSQLGMSIELTGEGLVVRWPGELDPKLAVTLRDLGLRVRERLIAVLRARGDIADEGGVRIQAAPGTLEAEAEAEAAAVLEAEAVLPGDRSSA